MSVDHYENFPVASWLCPPTLRPAVAAIYHYARTADDIADEGQAPPQERLHQLARYRQALLNSIQPSDRSAPLATSTAPSTHALPPGWSGIFVALNSAIERHNLPIQCLLDLLDAFEQDVRNPPYPDRDSLLDYCRRSANPVGRLLLHLWGIDDARSQEESDAICSALQLINFWQDFSVDHPRGRCYVPQEDAMAHGLDPAALPAMHDGRATAALVADLCAWAHALMSRGQPLALRVPGRAGWELRLVIQGGFRILERIRRMEYCTLRRRPTLGPLDLPPMLWSALMMDLRNKRT